MVVAFEEHQRERVCLVRGLGIAQRGRGIIDEEGSVLEYVYANKFSVGIVTDVNQGMFSNGLRPFEIPPVVHVGTEAL